MKRCLVTGSSSGIGLATSKILLEKGYEVIGIGRRKASIDHKKYIHCRIDLEEIDTLTDKIKKIEKKIDILVCSAGVGKFGMLEELSPKEILSSFHTNFLSHLLIVKTLLPSMKKHKSGDIFFIGSTASLQGKKEGSIYCSTKFALRGFAQALREECSKSNIRVTQIHPGMVNTPFYKKARFEPKQGKEYALNPEDVGKALLSVLEMEPHLNCDEIILTPLKKGISFKKL